MLGFVQSVKNYPEAETHACTHHTKLTIHTDLMAGSRVESADSEVIVGRRLSTIHFPKMTQINFTELPQYKSYLP